jgi:hypothetical protein
MGTPAGTEGFIADWLRLIEHLPNYRESDVLVLLKGHLLIEELLRSYINRKFPNPKAFDHEQFTFAQCLTVCEAATAEATNSWVFEAARKLNRLRNDVAHNLEPQKLSNHLLDFVSWVEAHESNPVGPPSERGQARMYMAITELFHSLSALLHNKYQRS